MVIKSQETTESVEVTSRNSYLFSKLASTVVLHRIFIKVPPGWATNRHGVPSGKWFNVTVPIWLAHSHLCRPTSFPEPG